MNCRFCNAEMNEEEQVCPACGKAQQEQVEGPAAAEAAAEETLAEEAVTKETLAEEAATTEACQAVNAEAGIPEAPAAQPSNPWKALAIIACCGVVVLLALVLFLVIRSGLPADEPTTEPTTASTSAPIVYDTYHGEPADVLAAADAVAAAVGEHQLTNRQLQVYYWGEFFNLSEYLSYYGVDYTKPLNTQGVADSGQSWEQFFVDLALRTWHKYVVLGMEAQKQGFELDEDTRKMLEGFPAALEENAVSNGFSSAKEMLELDFGTGVTMDEYMWYLEMQYLGQHYYETIYTAYEPSREEVSAYFDENAASYTQYGITKESGKLLDVRHILVQPEGAEIDASTGHVTATDAQWEACRQAAQELLDGWAAGDATEDTFAALVAEHSVDPGSAQNGGLYTAVGKGQMVEAFDTWMFDESRQTGDTGLVKTEFGYHIMYFVGGDEGWYLYGKADLQQSKAQEIVDGLMEAAPMETYTDKIVLDSAVLGAYKPAEETEATDPS